MADTGIECACLMCASMCVSLCVCARVCVWKICLACGVVLSGCMIYVASGIMLRVCSIIVVPAGVCCALLDNSRQIHILNVGVLFPRAACSFLCTLCSTHGISLKCGTE